METVTIPKKEYDELKKKASLLESEIPVNPNLYEELKNVPKAERSVKRIALLRKRFIECEENLKKKKYYREDLGF